MLLLAIIQANPIGDMRVIVVGGLMSLLLSLLLEGLLMLVSGRQGQFQNILLGIFFCYFSFLGLYCFLIKTLSFRRSFGLDLI
jgi:hypothetical protein